MKTAVIGGVQSTALLLHRLHVHGYRDVRVWAYAPADRSQVSGWVDLVALATGLGYLAKPFSKITECLDGLRDWKPDVIFAVGLSQLIPEEMLRIPRLGSIGFHPTRLPVGRGRAPIAWIVLDGVPAAATFFRILGGVDDGPIMEQEPFDVLPEDDALDVSAKLLDAMGIALDRLLPAMSAGIAKEAEQDHALATWYGRRAPDDGVIEWGRDAGEIARHIRSATNPHPGAFTFAGNDRIVIWKCEISQEPLKGVQGRILWVGSDQSFLVQCGRGLIKVTRWASDSWQPKVGQRLGFSVQMELSHLRSRCLELSTRVEELERRLQMAGIS